MEIESNNKQFFELLDSSSIKDELYESYLLFDSYEILDKKVAFKTLIPFEKNFDIVELAEPSISYDESLQHALNKLNEKANKVLYYRLIDKLVLADIAELVDVTRERVRQIEDAAIRKLPILLPKDFLQFLNQELEVNNFLFLDEIPIIDVHLKHLICLIISHKKFPQSFIYDSELNALVKRKKDTFYSMNLILLNFIRSMDEAKFNEEELKGHLSYLFPKIDSNYLIQKLIDNNELLKIGTDILFFQTLYKTKREKLEFIYTLYQDGFEIAKNMGAFKDQLNIYFPQVFDDDSDRAITGLVSFSEKILLWEWGKHIHIKFVKDIIDNYDFTDLLKYIDTELENILAVDLDGFYSIHKNTLETFDIPGKYALHTMLKIKYPDDYSYQDSPRVSSVGAGRLELSNVLLQAMNENKVYALEELSNILNTPNDRIQQLIERVPDIIVVNTHEYIKREHLNISNNLLDEIVNFINNEVKNLQFFYIGLIINNFRNKLHVISQYNVENTLLELLRKYDVKKDFNITNTRIVDKSFPITRESLNFHNILEQFMESENEISKNELFNFFIIRGLDQKHIMNYYFYSRIKKVVRINDETFIKVSSIGLDDKKIKALTSFVKKYYKDDIKIEDIILSHLNELPKITIEWNKFILCDLLDRALFKIAPSNENPQYIEIKSKEESSNG